MTRRTTKYDDDVPVFPGINGVEFYVEDHSTEGRLVEDGIVLVDEDGIVGELVNPSDKPGKHGREGLLRFGFGAVGTTFLLVWASSVEDGLELAAGWLETNAPGHLMTHDSPEINELYAEAREELGYGPDDADDDAVYEKATTDLTQTESGYLTSYEWTVDDVTDKKLVEAAVYASDLADYRFHATAGSGVDIVEGMDVYFFLNPAGDGSSFWSVEGSKDGADKTSVIVLANGESHAERTAQKYLDRVFGSDYVMLADEIDDSEELYWPLAAISEWAREGKKGPFELLPKVGEQTANAGAPKDKRIKCPFCGVRTWSTDYKQFMSDHDRPDGRRCVRAAERSLEASLNYHERREADALDELSKPGISAAYRSDLERIRDESRAELAWVRGRMRANARHRGIYSGTDARHEANASYGSDRWDPQIANQVRQIVLVIGAKKALSAARQDGRERVDPHMAEQVRKIVKLTGVTKFESMVAEAGRSHRRNSGSGSLTANSMQPFRGDQLVLIEKRDRHGKLDFSEPQPPSRPMKFDAVYRLYFDSDSSGDGSWESLKAWLDRRGWQLRAKTW